MYTFFENDTSVKWYLVNGGKVRSLRLRLKLGFNEFCFRAGISSRTLASIEKRERIVIKVATMNQILIGFNLCHRGVRKSPITVDQFIYGKYKIYHSEFVDTSLTPRRASIYLNPLLSNGVTSYAMRNNVSPNKAIIHILRNYFGIQEDELQYEKLQPSSFLLLGKGAV